MFIRVCVLNLTLRRAARQFTEVAAVGCPICMLMAYITTNRTCTAPISVCIRSDASTVPSFSYTININQQGTNT